MAKGFYICTANRAEVLRGVDGDEPEVNIYVQSSANIFENDEEAEAKTLEEARELWDIDDEDLDEINVAVARIELDALEQIVSILKNGALPDDNDSILDDNMLT